MNTLCSQPRCGNLAVERGKCNVHKRHLPGSTREWRKLRAIVLKRNPFCWRCGAPSTDADHIIPRAMGGTDELSNLRGACAYCNRSRNLSSNKVQAVLETK